MGRMQKTDDVSLDDVSILEHRLGNDHPHIFLLVYPQLSSKNEVSYTELYF